MNIIGIVSRKRNLKNNKLYTYNHYRNLNQTFAAGFLTQIQQLIWNGGNVLVWLGKNEMATLHLKCKYIVESRKERSTSPQARNASEQVIA